MYNQLTTEYILMQTFLPYPNIEKCTCVLDPKRLGKQRVEAFQIRNILKKKRRGEKSISWANHPAVLICLGRITWGAMS